MGILIHTHSGLRWLVLILLIAAIGNALVKIKSSEYAKKDKLLNLFAMVTLHIQLLLGLILYFMHTPHMSFAENWMKNAMFRFFGMEHLIGMVLAIALITIGRKKAEKKELPSQKHRTIAVWYIIGFILILAFIPWPFRNLGITSWF